MRPTQRRRQRAPRLTPSIAFLRGRVWDTNPASQSWILGPRELFVAPAPAREQSLSWDTPEPRLRTCPTWAAAPPSSGAGAGAIPSLAGQSMAYRKERERGRPPPCPPPYLALVGKRLSPHCSPAGTLQGSSLSPGVGVSVEWSGRALVST